MKRSLVLPAGLVLFVSATAAEQSVTNWLKAGFEIRGRAEGYTGIGYQPAADDAYYVHRLRLNLSIEPRPWLRFFVQGQDSRAAGYRGRAPSSIVNPLDVRQAYVGIGSLDNGSWELRMGRQELAFGEERLVGPSNWGNVARTFDAVKLSYARTGVRLDWFASSVVAPDRDGFDRLGTANKFYGFYSSFDRPKSNSVLQPYFFWKTNTQTRGERGRGGDLDVYTGGVRAAGRGPRGADYSIDLAFQTGHAAGDDIRAWAGHWSVGYAPWHDASGPRLVAEYNYASGDQDPHDGRRGTFDQLYPTNHSKYGIADRVGWRNIHDAMGGLEWKPSAKWKFNADYRAFWLASRRDGLYSASGSLTVLNDHATSGHVGGEIDIQATCRLTKQLVWGFGYAHLFPGEYLRQSTDASGVTYPYVIWEYRF